MFVRAGAEHRTSFTCAIFFLASLPAPSSLSHLLCRIPSCRISFCRISSSNLLTIHFSLYNTNFTLSHILFSTSFFTLLLFARFPCPWTAIPISLCSHVLPTLLVSRTAAFISCKCVNRVVSPQRSKASFRVRAWRLHSTS